MMRPGLLALFVTILLGATPTAVGTQELRGKTHEIAGVYYCDGVDAAGNAYHGKVVIERNGSTVLMRWTFASQLAGVGFGVLNGESLAVSYFGSTAGVALYRVEGNTLVGQWTAPEADGAVFSETLTPVPDGEGRPREERRQTPDVQPRRQRPLVLPGVAA